MDLAVEFGIAIFSAGFFCLLLTQFRVVNALRWWLCASIVSVAASGLEWLAEPTGSPERASMILSFALVCGLAQLVLVGFGLLSRSFIDRRWSYGWLIAGVVLLLLSSSLPSNESSLLETMQLVVPVVCGLLAAHIWKLRSTDGYPSVILLAFLLSEFTFGVLARIATFPFVTSAVTQLIPNFAIISWSMISGTGNGVVALTLAYLTINEVRAHNTELENSAKHLGALLDLSDCGICEVNAAGRVEYVNEAAATMLSVSKDLEAPVELHDKLEYSDDELSSEALASFVLRPSTPINRARAQIRGPLQSVISTEWSSTPLLRDGNVSGAVVTMSDVSDRDSEERFVQFRTDILEMIARNRPVDEVTRLLATIVERRIPAFRCSVLLCDAEYFRVTAAPSLPEEYRAAMESVPCNRSFRSQNRDGADDSSTWQRTLRTVASHYGFEGLWTEPMVSSANELLGTVVLNTFEMRQMSTMHVRVLREAARLAALAVEHRRSYDRLLHQGHHDALTGLPNRLLLEDRLKQTLARAARSHTQAALMCLDLDRFKFINDTLGHSVGDQFLQQISVRLASRIRTADTIARTGGDEFVIILSDVQDRRAAVKVAESLIASLRDPFQIEDHTLYGSATIGVAVFPKDGNDAETLHRNADRAMYRGKALGKNSVQSYSADDSEEETDRIEIDTQLHRAIEQGTLAVHYQPQFTCERRLSGFEALLRFNHPKLGMVPPTRFIPLAEESGLVLPIGEWVLQRVCRQIAEWQAKGMRPIRVAVNVSPLQFAQADFSDTVSRALRDYNVNPTLLELELTEGVLMSSVHDSERQIEAMAKTGVRMSVDDFGTGYSSLSYLHQLPIQVLKIDRSFISKMHEPEGTRCIVEAIISLAHRLGLQAVAEGVENENQLALLKAANCDLIQGFFFSHPLNALDAASLLWQDTMLNPGIAVDHEFTPVLQSPAWVVPSPGPPGRPRRRFS